MANSISREDLVEANYEPTPPPPRLGPDITRMRGSNVTSNQLALGTGTPRGRRVTTALVPRKIAAILTCLLAVQPASADPGSGPTPDADPPPRPVAPHSGPDAFVASWDLDGFYVWLGPSGAASHIDASWDSTIGADAAMVRIREHSPIALLGGALGASRWTARGGGRLWLDALVGSRLGGKMIGVSGGPIVELSDLAHPRLGGSLGLWAFIGITPFVRVGVVQELGAFGEVGIHIALPVFRRHHGAPARAIDNARASGYLLSPSPGRSAAW